MDLLNLLQFWKKPEKVYTQLDEETIKTNERIKMQQSKIASQEAQIVHLLNKERTHQDKKTEEEKQNEQNKKFIEQKQELDEQRNGKVIKLSKFYKHLLTDKKFKDKLEICDKNDEIVIGKFGDFGIMGGGKLCIIDKDGEIMAYGKTLSHVLYKPDAFENMARRGRFLIPRDKDGNFMEDLEYKELPEPIDAVFDEETGKVKRIQWSRVKTSEVKKIIADKMEQINNLQGELEMAESHAIKLQRENEDLKRSLKVNKVSADIADGRLSKEIEKLLSSQKAIESMHSQLLKLSEEVATYKTLIDKKDSIIEVVIAKLDRTGDPMTDIIKENIKKELQFYKEILPDRVEVTQEAPPEPKPLAQPGDVIKK